MKDGDLLVREAGRVVPVASVRWGPDLSPRRWIGFRSFPPPLRLPSEVAMDERPLSGRRALVTGASAGIGRACARALSSRGADTILAARRRDRLEALASELVEEDGTSPRVAELDIRDGAAIEALERSLSEEDRLPDILVNNAGLARGLEPLHRGDPDDWDEMIDTNVRGLLRITRAFVPHMVEAGRGHIVNLGSIAGHQVYPSGNVYNATKFAVRALTEALNVDLVGTRIRVSSVDPGLVETEFSDVRFRGDRERAGSVYEGYRPLTPEDVAETVAWILERPPHVNVLDLVLLPTDQRNAYVIDRD